MVEPILLFSSWAFALVCCKQDNYIRRIRNPTQMLMIEISTLPAVEDKAKPRPSWQLQHSEKTKTIFVWPFGVRQSVGGIFVNIGSPAQLTWSFFFNYTLFCCAGNCTFSVLFTLVTCHSLLSFSLKGEPIRKSP